MNGPAPLTVVVPTHRRPAALARALGALAGCVHEVEVGVEVVVVDNDAEPHEPPALPSGLAARVVHERTPGAQAARRRGVAEATGGVVVLLDDDVVPQPGWLAGLAGPVLRGEADATGGRVLLDPAGAVPTWLPPGLRGYLTELDLGPVARPLRAGEYLLTASLAARTELLAGPGVFRADLGPTGRRHLVADDVHLVRTLHEQGARLLWVPESLAFHELAPERLRPGWLVRRAYLQGRSDWRVDRAVMETRRAGGARVATSWAAGQLRRRAAEGPHAAVALHATCDLARTVGALAEAASWQRGGRHRSNDPEGTGRWQ